MDDPREVVKATSEAVRSASDAASKALDIAEKAGKWLVKVMGEDASGLLRDRMFYFRAKNALRLEEKLDRILKQRRIRKPKAIPLRLSIPFLEAATLEDEPDLQERWARLLANAMDPDVHVESERSHASVLKDISPTECLVLEEIAQITRACRTTEITIDVLTEALERDPESINVALCGLNRQKLVERKPRSMQPLSDVSTWMFENSAFYLTAYGLQFFLACAEDPTWSIPDDGLEDSGKLKSAPPRWQAYKGE